MIKRIGEINSFLKACIVVTIVLALVLPGQNLGANEENIQEKNSFKDDYGKNILIEKYYDTYYGKLGAGRGTDIFYPTDDTFIDQINPNANYGASDWLLVRRGGTGYKQDTLVKFDLSTISPGTTITSATLKIYYDHYQDGNPSGKSLKTHRITSSWSEGTVTWNTRPSYDAAVISSSTVPGSAGAWMEWDLTGSVQDIVDGTATNYGWEVEDPSGSGYFSMIYSCSKDSADSDYHPYLEVEYEMEEEPVGANWLGNIQITNDVASSEYPSIQSDSYGDLHVVWHDDRDGNYEIYYQKMDNDGYQLVNDTRLTNNPAASKYPSLCIDSSDELHVVWQDERDGNYEIYYTKLNNEGVTLVNDTRITNELGDSKYPAIMISDADNVHIAWQDERNGNPEIYYKKLDNDGGELTTDARITSEASDSQHPSIGVYYDLLAHILWHDERDGNYEIYYDEAEIDLAPNLFDYWSTDLDPEKWHLPQNGTQLNIDVNIANNGDIDVYDVDVEILFDDTTTIWSGEVDVSSGSETPISFGWTPTQSGEHTLSVKIDPLEELAELNRIDNNQTIPISIVEPSDVHGLLMTEYGTESYQDAVIACNNLYIGTEGELQLDNSHIILYGAGSEVTISEGGLIAQNSMITTSHPDEYISSFYVDSSAQLIQIENSEISNLGGGIMIDSAMLSSVVINGNTIENSQQTAITCQNGAYIFGDNIILNSGLYDFNVIGSIINVYDSYFDRDKVHIDGPAGQFTYSKHVGLNIMDENGYPANHAYVQINDTNGGNLYTGYTDENGEIPPQLFPVFTQDDSGSEDTAPYNIFGTNISSGSFTNFGVFGGGLYHPGDGFFGDGNGLGFYIVKKYAILWAGWDSTSQTGTGTDDRYHHWNDIEYMYHVLTGIRGYNSNNIRVLFMNGKDDDGNTNSIIDYSATAANLQTALQDVGSRMSNSGGRRDNLFFFSADHGGDVTLCTTSGGGISDATFAGYINQYVADNASKIFYVMGQCHSGGFIDNLHGDNRFIATAARKEESSWGYYNGHNYFLIEFISAYHNHTNQGRGGYPDQHLSNYPTDKYLTTPTNNPYHKHPLLWLDDNYNGFISFQEAFDYALDNDLKGPVDGRRGIKEHPQMADDDVVVMAGKSGNVSIFWYDGDGTLSGKIIKVGGTLEKVLVYDLDKDRDFDLIAADTAGNQVKVMLNNGDWTLSITNYSVPKPHDLCVADLDKDGYNDIISATLTGGQSDISILFNNGDGTFGGKTGYNTGWTAQAIAAADIDKDGDIEIIVCSQDTYNNPPYYNRVYILMNDGTGYFSYQRRIDMPYGSHSTIGVYPTDITVGDVDCDYDNDLVVTAVGYTGDDDVVLVFLNNGTGWFTHNQTLDAGDNPLNPTLVHLDNNLNIDLLVTNTSGPGLAIFKNMGIYNLYSYLKGYRTQRTAYDYTPLGLFATDLDGDDDNDIIIPGVSYGSYLVFVYRNNDYNIEGKYDFSEYVDKDTYRLTDLQTLQPCTIHGTNRNLMKRYYAP